MRNGVPVRRIRRRIYFPSIAPVLPPVRTFRLVGSTMSKSKLRRLSVSIISLFVLFIVGTFVSIFIAEGAR